MLLQFFENDSIIAKRLALRHIVLVSISTSVEYESMNSRG